MATTIPHTAHGKRRALDWTVWMVLKVAIPLALGVWGATWLHLRIYPPTVVDQAPTRAGGGPIRLTIQLPGLAADLPEPLLVCGKTGNATMIYVRFYSKNRVRLGVDLWGTGGNEGDLFTAPASQAVVTVDCYLPCLNKDGGAFHPPGAVPDLKPDELAVLVDGVVRLRNQDRYPQPSGSPLYFGANPLGGSVVSDRYVGTILRIAELH